jgi:hypothetical protein
MSSTETQNPPSGWTVNESAGPGVDLRVQSNGRGYMVMGAAALAIFVGWKTLVQWHILSRESLALWLGLTALLTCFVLWCAFADEVWHLESNCLVHRIDFRKWGFTWRYQNAELEIVVRFTKFGRPYYRLYAVVNGKSHFLIERGKEELRQFVDFISFHTGWRIRSQTGGF